MTTYVLKTFNPQPRLFGRTIVLAWVRQGGKIVGEPAQSIQLLQFAAQHGIKLREIAYIIGGIMELCGAERTVGPISAGMRLIQMYSKKGLDKGGITNLFRMAQQRGRQLCIENRLWQDSAQMVKNLQILPCRMHDLDDLIVIQKIN